MHLKLPKINLSDLKTLLKDECTERFEEGYEINVDEFRKWIERADSIEELLRIYEDIQSLDMRKGYEYVEPSTLAEINKERPSRYDRFSVDLSQEELKDKVLGGWLGRCAGCMLGKPVEGWTRDQIRKALSDIDEYPLRKPYFPFEAFRYAEKGRREYARALTRGNISRAERDDDIDYTILNLLVYEKRGCNFTTEDIAGEWLMRLPYHMTYTAERVAYRNLIIGLSPPDTAIFLNPYREWIGAQIRADLWGYVNPGDPERALEYAFRDARLSHTKNGIYGEMYMAALISLAYTHDDPLGLVEEGLKAIPARSRLAEAIRYVISLYRRGLEWEETITEILAKYGSYHFVHTINNAALVVAALLWGEGDYGKTITYAVLSGLDTDCNGATAGSIMGVMLGASRLPEEWVKPLNDTVASALCGLAELRISDLAKRTLKLIT